jgi:aryl-alcohol dehydrogenase-like predicted oxidoreductase
MQIQQRRLGRSGIEVPVLSLGSWQTFEHLDHKTGLDIMAAAIEAGITFLDDARYDDRTGKQPLRTGYSEVVFGELLRKGGWPRERLIIANKAWLEFYPKESIAAELEGSLKRLGLDHLDLLYCAPTSTVPVEEIVSQMNALVQSGKIRAWGFLNWRAAQIEQAYAEARARGAALPCAAQLPYSLLQRRPVESQSMQATCETTGMSVVASACLGGGLLTGKYDDAKAPARARLDAVRLRDIVARGVLEQTRTLTGMARELDATPAQLALAFCIANPNVASVLFGATSVKQLHDNLRCLELLPRVDATVMTRLRALFPDDRAVAPDAS